MSWLTASVMGVSSIPATIAGMAALERRLFAARPATAVRPTGTPPPAPAALTQGFTWSLVALTDMFLDQEPSEQTVRDYAETVVEGARRYTEMAER